MDSLWRLRTFFRPYRKHMMAVIAATIGVTALNLIGPWIIREVLHILRTQGPDFWGTAGSGLEQVRDLNSSGLAGTLAVLTGVFAAAHIVRAGCQFVVSYVAHHMAWNFVSDLRVAIYDHLQNLSLRFYHDKQTGEIMSRVLSDTTHIEPLVAHNIPDVIVNTFLIVGITGILLYLNPELALLTLIPIPLLAAVVFVFSKHMRGAFRTAQEKLADFSAILQDNISGIKEILIFTREKHEGKRVETRSRRYTSEILRALRIMAVYHPSVEFLGTIGTILILFFGGMAALRGEIPIEDLVAFLLYLGMFYQPVMLLARMNEQVQMAMASADRISELLVVESDVKEAKHARTLERVRGEIAFENVHFGYSDSILVLEDISFVIRPGESLALVGPTGVGKSTIASLISRFYDPVQGRITIDGQDLRSVRLQSLRHNISMVLQDTFLFNGTVLENILYSNPGKDPDQAMWAAQVANAAEFIEKLPQGYDTQIGERGVRLSGGQKQRLSIARAVLKDAPILILDEATSAVDVETEGLIQEALQKLMVGRTTLVIAHRLSTIRNATNICVLENGRIAQFGPHGELMDVEGTYRRLYARQLAQAANSN